MRCITISKANAFENLLEPLQKLLRLSPAVAATLARPDMFERIGQKLHHTKPAVRVNLLRILSTICDACDERCSLLSRYGLLDAIRELQKDSRVLVRELASQLVKSSEESDHLNGQKRRPTRRRSTSITPPSLISSHSMPTTPQISRTGGSKLYLEGRENLHPPNGLNGSLSLRPGSRDGRSSITNSNGHGSAHKPRLAHRLSQQITPMSQQKEETRTPTSLRTPSLLQSRRRRPTNSGPEWA